MSNETRYYFGSYLEIKVKKQPVKNVFYACKNNHEQRQNFKYCFKCGCLVDKHIKIVEEYPAHFCEFLSEADNEKYEDELLIITPPSLNETGTILAIDGTSNDECWLYLDRSNSGGELKKFPSYEEIATMEKSLTQSQSSIINALKNNDSVLSVEIVSGYVLDAEY